MSDYRKNLSNMMCLDIFVSSLSPEDYKSIQSKIKTPKRLSHPLPSYGMSALETPYVSKDYAKLLELKNKNGWEVDLKKILKKEYQVLIITDPDQKIEWVSEGFLEMTGYSVQCAIGKKHTFLQGIETSSYSKELIRKKLDKGEPFTETLLNYRKNGESYLCEITIYPLFTKDKEPAHFLALEKEVQ